MKQTQAPSLGIRSHAKQIPDPAFKVWFFAFGLEEGGTGGKLLLRLMKLCLL